MKVAVLSDVHGNAEALHAVLAAARAAEAGALLCLGDVVGYGPDPDECVTIVERETVAWVLGNHDLAALPEGRGLWELFRPDARAAIEWTQGRLSDKAFAVLRDLPVRAAGPWGWAAHGSPDDPTTYVIDPADAAVALERVAALEVPADSPPGLTLLWLGHTHLPALLHGPGSTDGVGDGSAEPRVVPWEYGSPVVLSPGRWLVNPGSVGQPRDSDPRARWALLDTEEAQVSFMSVEYDYRLTQRKMIEAGLPMGLVLFLGW